MPDPRLLVVAQRYGDVAGGAELHARQLATRLAGAGVDVEIATTTARDYWTWRNEFPAGEDRIDGLRVRRFAVAAPRAPEFRRAERAAFAEGHSLADERAFIEAQGPVVPELLDFLMREGDGYDHILFFTYIYYPTVYGLPLVADRAVLVPTAHDEPAIRLTTYRALFHAPRAIAFNTAEEREMVQRLFRNARIPNEVVGVGVDVAPSPSAERFRAAHGIEGPILLYVGRIVESKGCDELFAFFTRWRELAPDAHRATLVVAGHAEMRIPDRPDVRHVGYLSDAEKFDAYDACDVFVMPSRYESLSMVALEAWAMGRPLLCHAECEVLRGMSRRAGAGLYYRSFAEFAEAVELLLSDGDARARLGARGRRFVDTTYTWPRVIETYLDLFAEVRARNRS
ncbi:MAG TPA: glycosyltransferase family 4 protein [Candidatus Dormibacteraeota bacterium]|nr:glycosyltransferase family 4 protein [Candidatus Dormibacteraeota bacterium]